MSQRSQFLNTPKNPGLIPDMSPLEHLLDQDVTPRQVCGVLAKIFQVQQTEVALLRLDGGLLQFIYPDELRTAGSIPLSSSSIAAHTAISKKSEIFNNFARVKHASIFETIKPEDNDETAAPAPIQKLMSVPVMDRDSAVVGVIQISRKGLDPKFAQDFSREDLHDLELAAGLLATAPALMSN
jgi:GAF domain-containing protein